MSIQARAQLVNHPHLFFQADTQKGDLMSVNTTKTELIAGLLELLSKGHMIVLTAVKTDHHDDSDLGWEGTHEAGFAADCWPLNSANATDYADASSQTMTAFLADIARSPWLFQVGLAGSAITPTDVAAAGTTEFNDSGADHIHIGCNDK